MTTPKEAVAKILETVPDEASYDDIQYRIYVRGKIEKAIKDSIARSFNMNQCKLTTDIIMQSIKSTKPISDVMRDKIKEIKDWAKDRARFASSLGESEIKDGTVTTKSGEKMTVADSAKDDSPNTVTDAPPLKVKKKKSSKKTDPETD